ASVASSLVIVSPGDPCSPGDTSGRAAGCSLEGVSDLLHAARPNGAGDLLTVAEEDERRPELHPERPSELAPRAVLDLDMRDIGQIFQGLPDGALRAGAD